MKLCNLKIEENNAEQFYLDTEQKPYLIVLKQFVSPKMVQELLTMLDFEIREANINVSKSYTYPLGFQEFSSNVTFDFQRYETELFKYFNSPEKGVFHKIELVYQKWMEYLSKYIRCNIELAKMDKEGVLSFSVRRIPPYQNHIHLHNENMVPKVHPAFFDVLSTKIDVFDNLSVFVLLQKPSKGGHLKVYNDYFPHECSSSFTDINKNNFTLVDMEVGDLVLFTAGGCYHEVTEVEGDLPRITMGSFLGKSLNSSSLISYS